MRMTDGSVMRGRLRCIVWTAVTLLLAGMSVKPAYAQVIDQIEIKQVGDKAEIQIKFITRIQYLRQASLKNGDVRVYLNLMEIDALDPRLVLETRDSPPSDLVPHFSVTYPEIDSSLSISFGKKIDYKVRAGKDGRSIIILTPIITPKGEAEGGTPAVPVVAAAPAPVPEISPGAALPSAGVTEREAKQLIDSARDAMKSGQSGAAIESLNRLLNLPPNKQSQTAQKLIGEAREKSGEFSKARAEYELYLKLYPDAADARQVQERLSRLPVASRQAAKAPVARKAMVVDDKMRVTGSFSQTYYKGELHSDTTTVDSPVISSFTSTDQRQLVSQVDITARKRTETTDTRIVFRDSYTTDYLPRNSDKNRLTAAYVEQSARDRSYLYRLGRQSGSAGGVQGRFDGMWAGYNINPMWRINGVIGADKLVSHEGSKLIWVDDQTRKNFAGVSVDLTRLPEQWSGSTYFIQQRVDGIVDRQAIGLEARYFDAQRNYTGVLDYDTLFKAVNIAMFQGNWMTEKGDTYSLLVDHRKSPSLQITNALQGHASQSIAALLQSGVTEESLRADAKALTQMSNLIMIGMTRPYSSRLKLGGDFRISNISGTGAAGTQPASDGSGNAYIYSVQAIGNNLLLENDLGVASASYIDAKTYKAQSLSFTQVETFRQNWRVDVSLQLSSQKDNLGIQLKRVTPSLKVSYRLNDSVSFEGEGGIENTHTTSATQDETSQRKYFFVGYRWDFH